MMDFMTYYFHTLQILHLNIIDLKSSMRNLLVFFNLMTLKLANATANVDLERDENGKPV